jgi:rhodanese-related sulfurtransferase
MVSHSGNRLADPERHGRRVHTAAVSLKSAGGNNQRDEYCGSDKVGQYRGETYPD